MKCASLLGKPMSSDAGEKIDGDAFDVVLVHGATGDGEGARVLRARPGHIEAGEVRPLREGQPLTPGGEVVRLVRALGRPCVYDVKVDYGVPAGSARRASGERAAAGLDAGVPRELGPHVRARAPRRSQLSRRQSVLARSSVRTRSRGAACSLELLVRDGTSDSPGAATQTPMKRRCAKLRSRRARSTLSAASSMSYSMRLNSKRFFVGVVDRVARAVVEVARLADRADAHDVLLVRLERRSPSRGAPRRWSG